MTPSKLEKAILLTVSYSSVFDFPLKKEEIKWRLIGAQDFPPQNFEKILAKLVKKKLLFEEAGFYFLKNSKKSIVLRKKRKKIALKKRSDARRFADFAQKIPFIKAIIITGSLSTNNTDFNDDIDWLIITTKRRLWIVRPLVLLISILFGKRRQKNGGHKDNSWCFNMFLEEGSLALPPSKRNIYTAHEVCQADFIFDRGGMKRVFMVENRWLGKYLPLFYKKELEGAPQKSGEIRGRGPKVRREFFLDSLNGIFYWLQYNYMKNHITKEVVRESLAFFHPRDTRGKVLKEWEKIVRKTIYDS